MKKYINAVLTILSVVMLFYVLHDQRSTIKQIKEENQKLIIERDSLRSELITMQIIEGRLEYIVDRAEAEMSPDCKEEFEKILHETE